MKPYLADNRALRLVTLCVLYSAQGIPDGFVRTALKNYLYDRGVSVEAAGQVVAMVSWPWMMKCVWGPFIDRYGYAPMGRRRPWILFAQSMMAITLIGMMMISDLATNFRLLAAMVLVVNIFASLQDVSVDALAIDMLPDEERGAANGFMYASSFAGNYVGARVLGGMLLTYGVSAAIGVQVAILAAIVLFPLAFRERPGELLFPKRGAKQAWQAHATARRPASLAHVFKILFRAYSTRATALGGVLAMLALLPVNAHFVYWPKYAQDSLGWSATDWVALEGGWCSIMGLAGSVTGGLLATAFGAKRVVVCSLIAMSGGWFSYALLNQSWANDAVVSGLLMAEFFIQGALQVAMFALFMGICWSVVAATQFSSYMALMNLGNVLGAWLAYKFEPAFGIVNSHPALGCLQLALVVVALAIDPNETRRKLGDGPASDAPAELPELDAGLPFPPEPPR
jgi:PAT family beta-lactamase induction signal transducer AmpG